MTTRSLRLTEADRQHLVAGAAALGITLDSKVVAQLARFADLLDVWSLKVNLLSCGSARELVERHFLDSLSVAPVLPETGSLTDLGSGAGFPGVPLAILRPTQRVVLVESRRRRATFLREVRRTLELKNVEVLEQRAEQPPENHTRQVAGVVTRAVWSDESLLEICARWISPGGRLFWMRSEPLADSAILRGAEKQGRVQYRIGRDRLRTIEVIAMDHFR